MTIKFSGVTVESPALGLPPFKLPSPLDVLPRAGRGTHVDTRPVHHFFTKKSLTHLSRLFAVLKHTPPLKQPRHTPL